jgi:tetratricopeptide (TPR) repeat protein
LIGFVVLGVGVHFLHGYQVQRNAEGVRQQAQSLYEEGDLEEALQAAMRYRALRAGDPNSSKLAADIAFDMAQAPKASSKEKKLAVALMEHTLRLDDEDAVRRRKLLDYYAKNGWITSAIDHVKLLRDTSKPDAELEVIAAQCFYATGAFDEAAKVCNMLVGYDPNSKTFAEKAPGQNSIVAYALLAHLMQEDKWGDPAQADAVIERMIALNEKSVEAQLEAHRYWKSAKQHGPAKEALARAFELEPESPEVALLTAEQAIDDRRLDDAKELVSAALKKHPDEARLYRAMALVEWRLKRPDDGIKVLEDGLKQLPDSEVLFDNLINMQLDLGKVEEAEDAFKKLKALGSDSSYDYLEARFLMAEKNWSKAIERLNQAKNRQLYNQYMVGQIDSMLSKCYQALGDPDRAIELLSGIEGLTSAKVDLARMLAATGRSAEALEQYEEIAKALAERTSEMPYVWQPLLELRIWDQIRQPKEQRNWSKVEELIAALNKAGKLDPISNVLFQGDLLYNKGQAEEARTLYSTALHANPSNEALWVARLRLELETNGPDKSLKLAQQVPPAIENGVSMRLVRASIFARMPAETAKAGLMSVERDMDQLSKPDQLRLLHGLVLEYRKLKDRESTRRLLDQMMAGWQDDFFSRNLTFEMAREDGDIKTMEQMAAELRRVSDPNSPYPPVFDAVTKITAVTAAQRAKVKANPSIDKFNLTSEEKESLAEARNLLEGIGKKHSSWNEPHKWLAEICALENNPDGMLGQLRTALDKGPLDSNRTRQLYNLLVGKGLNAEAERVYQKLSGEKRVGTELAQVNILIQGKRFKDAKELLDTIELAADTPLEELLMYADARRRIGDMAKAEEALRQAVQLDKSSAHAWVLLVNTLVSSGKQSEAEAVVESAQEQVPAKERELVLAQCYEALRDLKRAEQSYLKTIGEKPRDLLTNQAVASFYLRTDRRDEAMKYLDTIKSEGALATSPTDKEIVSWAERGRAVAIATDGNWQEFKQAEELLLQNEENIRKSGNEPDSSHLLLRIALLAEREEPECVRAAVALFEELQRRQPLQASEMVNFARQYERVGEWQKAKDLMLKVLSGPSPEPLYFLGYAEMLLRNNELADVDFWLNRYDRVRNDIRSLPIRVRLLVRQGSEKQAVALLNRLLGRPPWTAARLPQARLAASQLHQLRQYTEAETIWRGFIQTEPSGVIMLATTVGMNPERDLNDALKLLEASLKFHTPREVLLVGMEILRARKADAQRNHFEDLGRWYKAAIEASPDDPQLEMLLGDMWEIRGDLNRAEQQYRRVLARNDLDPVTRAHIGNNLAFILSTQRKNTDEAVDLIEKAMAVYGPISDLLDTRGVAYLAAGNAKKALEDFREAVLVPSAMKWVHLAFAQSELGDQEGARQSLKKAQDMDLKRQDLYEAEWRRYENLARDLGM